MCGCSKYHIDVCVSDMGLCNLKNPEIRINNMYGYTDIKVIPNKWKRIYYNIPIRDISIHKSEIKYSDERPLEYDEFIRKDHTKYIAYLNVYRKYPIEITSINQQTEIKPINEFRGLYEDIIKYNGKIYEVVSYTNNFVITSPVEKINYREIYLTKRSQCKIIKMKENELIGNYIFPESFDDEYIHY